jgi:exonuclease III
MCADWNVVLNYEMDTRGYKHQNNPKSRDSLIQLMESLEICDVWRERNVEDRKFTWFNKKQMA